MKRKIIGISIGAIITFICGLFGFKKLRKAKKVTENLNQEDIDIMNQIIGNQKKLTAAVDENERLTKETAELLAELKKRLNLEDEGNNPEDIDTSLED